MENKLIGHKKIKELREEEMGRVRNVDALDVADAFTWYRLTCSSSGFCIFCKLVVIETCSD